MEENDTPVPRTRDLSVGQVAEWLVWTHLVAASQGDLHVFLPLEDRGIDGIVHRLSTDEYARVQVKGRVSHRPHAINLEVIVDELADDDTFVVAVDLDLASLSIGDYAVVAPAARFRELARRYHTADLGDLYEARIQLPPKAGNRWEPWCPRIDAIGERLLPPGPTAGVSPAPAAPAELPAPRHKLEEARRLGHRAEMEVLRRAADCDRINIFKAFPDLEPNEYVAYGMDTHRVLGIQVKSVSFLPGSDEAAVAVYLPPFHPSPTTCFVVLLADADATDFLPACALIPSAVVAGLLSHHGAYGQLSITRHVTGQLSPWRIPLAELGHQLAVYEP